MSYDLRRLSRHGLIERIPKTFRYRLTDMGLRVALFFTKVHARILRPGFSQLFDPRIGEPAHLLSAAIRVFDKAVELLFDQAQLQP